MLKLVQAEKCVGAASDHNHGHAEVNLQDAFCQGRQTLQVKEGVAARAFVLLVISSPATSASGGGG